MPSLLSLMFGLITELRDSCDSFSEAISAIMNSLIGVVCTIILPITAPILSGIDLIKGDMDDYLKGVDMWKLFEILGWILWANNFRAFD